MICKTCEKRIVLHAFSEGSCEICGRHVVTAHTPCNKICPDCSEINGLCEACGVDMKDEEDSYQKEIDLREFDEIRNKKEK